jgi:lipopolysaccharide export system permease protein
MKLVDRYIFKALFGPFIFGMLGALVIVSFGNLLKAVGLLFEGRVARVIILEWFAKRTPEDMQFIFPVAIMLATLITFSQLSRTSELVALQAAGISVSRLMVPVVVFAFLVTGFLFYFLDRVVPPCMKRSQELWEKHIRTNQMLSTYKDNMLLRDSRNRLVFIGRFNLRTYDLEFVKIRDYSDDGTIFLREYSARRAAYRGGKLWELRDLKSIERLSARHPLKWVRRENQTMALAEGPEDLAQQDRMPQEMNFQTLLKQIRKLDERGLANTAPLKVELYLKTSFPFCIFIFSLIGSSMGLTNARSGGFIGFGISLVVTFFYYIVMSLSASLGKTGVLAPMLAAWIHNLVFGVVAVVMTSRLQNR